MKDLSILINADDKQSHINREVYGNFSEHLGRCIYNGIFVGEDSSIPNIHGLRKDIIEAFKNIKLPVLRWPGGCFADEYHWRDGIGEKSSRKKIVNTNWGGVVENNSFGTHEFMELCELVGCEPYISGNVGSGTVRELSEWVEYMTCPDDTPMTSLRKENGREEAWSLKYLGIGNENWGCGGNMDPQYYSSVYKQFASFCKNYGGNRLYKIACGPSGGDYNWTDTVMKNFAPYGGQLVDGISLHFYCIPDWNNKGDAVDFSEDSYYTWLDTANKMEELISTHEGIMERYDPENKIALIVDEWGSWYDVEKGTNPGFLYQQNTMRDAMIAAISLNIFNRHARRVKMANIAQAVNVLQAVILTEGEKMILTPTYHVFDLYKDHQGAESIYCHTGNEDAAEGKKLPMISSSASVKDGKVTVTLSNCSLTEGVRLSGLVAGIDAKSIKADILTGEAHAHNTFDSPESVTIKPHKAQLEGNKLCVELPPCSVVRLCIE
ncbi:MAG: alpha-N-arabinofuranosidase [Oscillospiraceae bacterium]|nr:alpha-N-arabinofuranosidase [Oscillospiraceae bacterium]